MLELKEVKKSVSGSIGVYHGFSIIYGRTDERSENEDGEEGREWRLPGF